MLLYTDIVSGDEICSDAFPMKLVDDIVYEVECRLVTIKPGADVDIGANPSAEEAEEALEEGTVQVNNVVHAFGLSKAQDFKTKKEYLAHLKDYLKKLKEIISKDEQAKLEEGAPAFTKKILANLKDYEFYTGSSMDPNGMHALLNYREDGITPYFTIWKHGLKETKC